MPTLYAAKISTLISSPAERASFGSPDFLLAESQKRARCGFWIIFPPGRREHLAHHAGDTRLKIYQLDLLDLEKACAAFRRCVTSFCTLPANPDARWGIANTRLDLRAGNNCHLQRPQKSMRRHSVGQIILSSSGTVYGDVGTTVTHEKLGPCTADQSLRAPAKLQAEALITAFCGTFGTRTVILRFGNIVGERTTHGAIYDFIKQLVKNSAELKVLGNGHQAKPYVYVLATWSARCGLAEEKCSALAKGKFEVFNVAPDDATSVRFMAEYWCGNWIRRPHENCLWHQRHRLAWRRGPVAHGCLTKIRQAGFPGRGIPTRPCDSASAASSSGWRNTPRWTPSCVCPRTRGSYREDRLQGKTTTIQSNLI